MKSPRSPRSGRTMREPFTGGAMANIAPGPRQSTATPPSISEITRRLRRVCRRHGIVALDVFGSVARGEARPGSDVDLIAKFHRVPGLDFVTVIEEMEVVLGVPVDLLLFEDIEEMTNPDRKAAITRDRRSLLSFAQRDRTNLAAVSAKRRLA